MLTRRRVSRGLHRGCITGSRTDAGGPQPYPVYSRVGDHADQHKGAPAMRLSVEFPSVSYRWGDGAVFDLARAIEEAGYDEIDMFDHVTMGHAVEGRTPGPYPTN